MNDTTSPSKAEEAKERFQRNVSIVISLVAALLLFNSLGAGNADWDASHQNAVASNTYAFYQAKNIRQNDLNLAANQLEVQIQSGQLQGDAKQQALKLVQSYREKAASYESDPATGEGKKELLEKAKAAETIRDAAIAKDPYFDFGSLLLQMAIILFSVVLISQRTTLLMLASITTLVGAFLSLNAFTMWFNIPGIG